MIQVKGKEEGPHYYSLIFLSFFLCLFVPNNVVQLNVNGIVYRDEERKIHNKAFDKA